MDKFGKATFTGSGTLRLSGTSTPPRITLEVTPQMMETLEEISRASNQPLDVVFTRAIALYKAALQANAQGKHVGYSDLPDALEVEFTGLGEPEGR